MTKQRDAMTDHDDPVTYRKLIAEHDAIDAAAYVVLSLTRRDARRPVEAAKALEMLAQLLRDHLSGEDAVIYQTILASRGGRHADMAEQMQVELERLKDDWETYLYRWDAVRIDTEWNGFVRDTEAMLSRIRERVTMETMVLYSLALHLDVIAVA